MNLFDNVVMLDKDTPTCSCVMYPGRVYKLVKGTTIHEDCMKQMTYSLLPICGS